MFTKIYLALLSVSIAVMVFLHYYAWSWLQSIGQPAAAEVEYRNYSNLFTTTLWLSTAALLVLANAVLWTGRAWAIWTTFLFFAVFAVSRYFGLEFAYIDFQIQNYGAAKGVINGPVIAVALIVLTAVIAFFDQFIVLRLRAKTLGEPKELVEEVLGQVDK